jgi:transposase
MANKPVMAIALISRRQAAEMFGVGPKTIYRWERAGLLTAIKLNSRTTRYHRHDEHGHGN